MTDRVRTLSITLDKDYRTDDVLAITSAIQMIKGVEVVETGPIVTGEQQMARAVVRLEMINEVLGVLRRQP